MMLQIVSVVSLAKDNNNFIQETNAQTDTNVLHSGDNQIQDQYGSSSRSQDTDEILQMPETVYINEDLPPDFMEVADAALEPPQASSRQEQSPPGPMCPSPPAPSLPPPTTHRPPRLVPRPIASLCYSSHSPPPLASSSANRTPWRVQEDEEEEGNAPAVAPSQQLQVESGVWAPSGNTMPLQDALPVASHPPPSYPTLHNPPPSYPTLHNPPPSYPTPHNPPPAVPTVLAPFPTLIQLPQNQTTSVPGYLESPTPTAQHLTSAPIVIPYSSDSSTLQQPESQNHDQAPVSYLQSVVTEDGTVLVTRYDHIGDPAMQNTQQGDLYVNNIQVSSLDNADSVQPILVLPPNATRSYPVAQTRNVVPNSREGIPRENQVNRFVPLTELHSSQPQSVTYTPQVFVNDRTTQEQSESQRNIVADPSGLVLPPAPLSHGAGMTYFPEELVNRQTVNNQTQGQNTNSREFNSRANPVTHIVITTNTPTELHQTQTSRVTSGAKPLVKNSAVQKQQMPNRNVSQDSSIPKKALESLQAPVPTSTTITLRELLATSESESDHINSKGSVNTQSAQKQELSKKIYVQVSRVSPAEVVVKATSTGTTVQRTLQSVRASVIQKASTKTNTKATQEQLQSREVSQQGTSLSPVTRVVKSTMRCTTTVRSVSATCGSTVTETSEKNSKPSEKEGGNGSVSRPPLLVDLTDHAPPVIDLTATTAPASDSAQQPSEQQHQPSPPPAVASVRPRVSGGEPAQEAIPAGSRSLTRRQELQLVREMTSLASCFDGLSTDDVVRLTEEFLEDCDVISSPSESEAEKNLSEKALTYVQHLLRHYSRLKAAVCQYERKQRRFHSRLEMAIRRGGFDPSRVFTVDAAPLCIVANRRVEENPVPPVVSVLAAVSAAGWTSAPLLVIAGDEHDKLPVRVAQGGMSVDGVRGVWYALSKDGRVTASLFLNWLRHFLDRLHCSPQKPVLMVMIDHPVCKNLAMLKFCRSRGVVLVGLPRDSTHDSPLLPASSLALLTCLRHVFNFILGALGKKQEGGVGSKEHPMSLYPERLALFFKFAFIDSLRRLGYSWGISSFHNTTLSPLKPLPAIMNYPNCMLSININESPMPSDQSMASELCDLQQQILDKEQQHRKEIEQHQQEGQQQPQQHFHQEQRKLREVEKNQSKMPLVLKETAEQVQSEDPCDPPDKEQQDRVEAELQSELNEMETQTPEVLKGEERRKRIKEAKIRMQAKKIEWNNAIRNNKLKRKILQTNRELQTGSTDNVKNQNTRMNRSKKTVLPQTVQTNHVVGSESSKGEIQNQYRNLQQNKETLEPSIQQVEKTPEQLLRLNKIRNQLQISMTVPESDFEVEGELAVSAPAKTQTSLPPRQLMQPSNQAPGLSMNVGPQSLEKTFQTMPLTVENSRQKGSGKNLSSCFTKEMCATSEFNEQSKLQPEVNVHLSYIGDDIDNGCDNNAEEFIDVSELMCVETRIDEVEPNRVSIEKEQFTEKPKSTVDKTREPLCIFNSSNGDQSKEIAEDGTERLLEGQKERAGARNCVPPHQTDESLSGKTACTDSQTSVIVSSVPKETQRLSSKVSMDSSKGTSTTALGDKPFAWPLKQYSREERRRVAVVAPQGVVSYKSSNINLSQGEKSSSKNVDSALPPNDAQEKPVVKEKPFPDSWGCDDKSKIQKNLWDNVIVLDDSDSETEICYSNVNVKEKLVANEELSCQFGSKESQNSSSDLKVCDSTVQVLPSKPNLPEQSLHNSLDARSTASGAPDSVDNLSSSCLPSCVPKDTSLCVTSNKSLESKCSSIPSSEEPSISSDEISNSSLPLNEVTCAAATIGNETANSHVESSMLAEDSSTIAHNNFRSRKNTKPKKRTDNIVLTKFHSESNSSSPKKKSNRKPKADDRSNSNSQPIVSRIQPVVVLERLPPKILHLFSTANKGPPKKEVVRLVKQLVRNLESSKATNQFSKKRRQEPCDKEGGKRRRSTGVDNDKVSCIRESPNTCPDKSSFTHGSRKGKSTVCATPPLCIYCGDFGPGDEIWVKCVKCLGWAHADCSGALASAFECDYCVYTKR